MDKEKATFAGTCQFAIQLTTMKMAQLSNMMANFDKYQSIMINGTDRLALTACLILAGMLPEVTSDERDCLAAALYAIKHMDKMDGGIESDAE